MQIHSIIDPRIESGTVDGQMLYWDNTAKRWKKIDTSKMIWDADNDRLGINQPVPTSTLDVNETVTVKRLLAGGVTE